MTTEYPGLEDIQFIAKTFWDFNPYLQLSL